MSSGLFLPFETVHPVSTPDTSCNNAFRKRKINFAFQQSSFALLRDLRIENRNADSDLDDLRVILRSSPAFLKEKIWRIDRIAPGEIVTLIDRDIELDGRFWGNRGNRGRK
jgi:hypothetical protein